MVKGGINKIKQTVTMATDQETVNIIDMLQSLMIELDPWIAALSCTLTPVEHNNNFPFYRQSN